MRYRTFGTTGVEVSTQCLGTMMFGQMGNADHDDCIRQINTALDAGINFIDTADVYSHGESETILGQAIASRRDEVVLATKCFTPMGGRNQSGGSRRWIRMAVEGSLRRLGTDHIDLYQVHRLDWTVDIDETLDALSLLVEQGKVLYLGSSTYPAEWIVEAQWAAARRGHQRFVSEQPQYSIFARSAEKAVLPTAARHRMAVIPWSPLAGGWLTGKYTRDAGLPSDSRFGGNGVFAQRAGLKDQQDVLDERYDLVERLTSVAKEAGLTLTQLALAFVDAHPAISATIIGPRTASQLADAIAAADLVLDQATLDAIDHVVRPGTDVVGISHAQPNPAMKSYSRRRG